MKFFYLIIIYSVTLILSLISRKLRPHFIAIFTVSTINSFIVIYLIWSQSLDIIYDRLFGTIQVTDHKWLTLLFMLLLFVGVIPVVLGLIPGLKSRLLLNSDLLLISVVIMSYRCVIIPVNNNLVVYGLLYIYVSICSFILYMTYRNSDFSYLDIITWLCRVIGVVICIKYLVVGPLSSLLCDLSILFNLCLSFKFQTGNSAVINLFADEGNLQGNNPPNEDNTRAPNGNNVGNEGNRVNTDVPLDQYPYGSARDSVTGRVLTTPGWVALTNKFEIDAYRKFVSLERPVILSEVLSHMSATDEEKHYIKKYLTNIERIALTDTDNHIVFDIRSRPYLLQGLGFPPLTSNPPASAYSNLASPSSTTDFRNSLAARMRSTLPQRFID